MDKYLSENKNLCFYFLEFRKAYNSMWRAALFKKHLGYGVSKNFVFLQKNIFPLKCMIETDMQHKNQTL